MQPLVSLNLKQYALDAWKTVENCTERKIVKLVGHVKHDFAMVCFRYGTIRKKKIINSLHNRQNTFLIKSTDDLRLQRAKSWRTELEFKMILKILKGSVNI